MQFRFSSQYERLKRPRSWTVSAIKSVISKRPVEINVMGGCFGGTAMQ